MADVFISYKSEERAAAAALDEYLRARGCSTWWDTSLIAGEHFNATIDRELAVARCVVTLWSKKSHASTFVQAEAMNGFKRSILVSARLDNVKLTYPYGETAQVADLRGWMPPLSHPGLRALADGVASKLGKDLAEPGTDSPTQSAAPKNFSAAGILVASVIGILIFAASFVLFPSNKSSDAAAVKSVTQQTESVTPKPQPFALSNLHPKLREIVDQARVSEQTSERAAARGRAAAAKAEQAAVRARQLAPNTSTGTFVDGGTWATEKADNQPDVGTGDLKEGEHYAGEWGAKAPGGYGVMIYAQSAESKYQALRAEGQFSNFNQHGNGLQFLNEGTRFAGRFQRGSLTGYGTIRYSSGWRYEGAFKDGVRDGLGAYWRDDGSLYQAGLWIEGEFSASMEPLGIWGHSPESGESGGNLGTLT